MKGKTLKICGLVVMLVFGLAMLFPTAIAQSEKGMYSPGQSGTTPGKGGTPPGQGGIPPGLAKNLGLSMDGDQVYWGDPDIMIGIGTIDPQYTLDVDGDIHAMGSLILGNSVTFDPNGNIILDDATPSLEVYNKDAIPYYTDLFIDSENQYVGIGTKIVVAGVRLGVDGNVLATGSITADGGDSSQWNDAYGWGDHSAVGYLTSYTETDPVFGAWDKSTGIAIAESQITDLDHFTNADETDQVFTAWDKSAGIAISESQITDLDHFTNADETDQVFTGSTAYGITGTQVSNWDTAYGWGNHASAGYLTGYTETDPQVGTISSNYVPKWDGSKLSTGSIYDNGNIGIGTTPSGAKLHVNGVIKADEIKYNSPRTQYLVISGEAFVPASNAAYTNAGGMGGAYRTTGSSGQMVTQVHLPHGAKVTEFKVFFYDNSNRDLTSWLGRLSLSGSAYSRLGQLDSSGITNYGSKTDTTISNSIIDNTKYGYHIKAYSTNWDGSKLRIMGAYVKYTMDEAL
jgi:hypothetical protein